MAQNQFSYEDAFPAPQGGNKSGFSYEDAFPDAKAPPRTLGGTLGDVAVTALKGAVGLPQAVVGLADIPTGGQVGKALEGAGVRFKDAQDALSDMYSPAQQAANRKVQEAEGFTGTAQAMLENPSTIATGIGESLPQMVGGAGVARGLLKAAPKIGAVAAGALGEGVIGAGSAAEQIREQTADGLLTGKQAALAGASGVATAALGGLGGKVAQRLGIGDVDTMLTQGAARTAGKASTHSMPRQVAQGALAEGVLEEMPQSMSEQALQNLALERPWEEGVGAAAAQGLITGAAMGGAGGAVGAAGNASRQRGADPISESVAESPAAGRPASEGPGADAAALPPDESSVFATNVPPTLDADALQRAGVTPPPVLDTGRLDAALADEQETTSATGMAQPQAPHDPAQGDAGTAPRAQTPSEAMGLDASAGTLSAAAVQAVDSGAHAQLQSAADTQAAIEEDAAVAKVQQERAREAAKQAKKQPQERAAVDAETGEIASGMAAWSDADLSTAFRGAQSRDVRLQLAQERQRRRTAREQQALQGELAAEQLGAAPGAERADATFARLTEDAAPAGAPQANTAQTLSGKALTAIESGAQNVIPSPAAPAAPTTGGSLARQAQTVQAGPQQQEAGDPPPAGRAAAGETQPVPAAAAPAGGGGVQAPGLNAPAAQPEFTTVKTVRGDNVTVRTADLAGDAPRLRQYTKDGKPKVAPAIHRDNLDATGEQGAAIAAENAGNPLFNTVTSKGGTPFGSRAAAQREVNRLGLSGTHDVVPTGSGFVGLAKLETVQEQQGVAPIAEGSAAPAGPEQPAVAVPGQAEAPAAAQESAQNAEPALTGRAPAAIESGAPAAAQAGRPTKKPARGVLAKLEAMRQARADYFTPGNIVKGYSGHDRVMAYTPSDSAGRWSVTVRAVEKQGGAWMDKADERERTHATEPSAREFKAGPVERAPRQTVDPETSAQQPLPEDGKGNSAPALAGQAQAATESGAKAGAQAQRPARAAAPQSTAERIEDFGEELRGARKMLYAEAYADGMAQARELDVQAHPLSKTWPEPDYARLQEGGAAPQAVALVRALRDAVPTKPQTAWKLKAWAQKVQALRGFADDILAGRTDAAAVTRELERAGVRDVANQAALYEAVGHARSLKGVHLSSARYSMYEGVAYDPPRTLWTVERQAKASPFGHWPRELARGDTREAAIAAFQKRAAELLAEESAPTRGASFEIYGQRAGGARAFFIGKKIGKNVAELKGGFADIKAARQYLAGHQAELEQLLAQYKAVPPVRRAENAPRIGQDHRQGADVAPAQFQETFGFRGVQFGNYVEGARRQQDLNQAYDALMDLAGVLELPPRALSLGGRLGLAFGARGSGGVDAAAAHYERGEVVINLTKRQGAGSLAHEWWHGLDNYFSRQRGDAGSFMSEDARRGDGVREEMRAAFRDVVSAIHRTGMHERSRKLDDRRTKEYWSTKPEMSARAFESYVIAKLQDQGAGNDYLANVVGDAAFALEGAYPYPTAGELPQIRAAFDAFFQAVQTREEGGATVLFRRDAAEPFDFDAMQRVVLGERPRYSDAAREQAVSSVRQTVDAIRAAWGSNAPEVVVAFDMQDLAVPDAARRADLRQRSGGASGAPEGFYWRGKAYLMASRLNTPADAARVLYHEVLGHHGLRGKFGNDLDTILNQVATMRKAEVNAKIKDYGLRGVSHLDRRTAAEEVLAEMAEKNPQLHFVRRAVAAIRNWLRAHVPGFKNLRLTDDDIIQAYILPARGWVERGGREAGAAAEGDGPGFSRSPTSQATYEARIDALFGGDKAQGGTRILDASEVMGLLGYPRVPLMLNESHLRDGLGSHPEMTAAAWKKVPGWIENPAAVYADPRDTGRLIVIAPETVAGYPVMMVIEPKPTPAARGSAEPFQLLVTAYAKTTGGLPAAGFLASSGHLKYVHTQNAPGIWQSAGVQFPRQSALSQGRSRILTEKQLGGYTRAQAKAAPDEGDAPVFSRFRMADLKGSALAQIDAALSHPGKVSLWDKTVGTMRHLAERSPAFKPVFETAQRQIDDVAMLASDAADMAPRLLPRVDSWRDLAKRPISAADNKAVARPLFEGTLTWGRDLNGKPALVDDLQQKYANLPADEKARLLLGAGRLEPAVLKMWQGLPLAQYESAVNARFESKVLKAGVVWEPRELQAMFGLTEHQAGLYREARAAIDRSIDTTARADMLRALGESYAPMRGAVLDAPNLTDALTLLVETLEQEARDRPDAREHLADLMHALRQRYDKARELMTQGYAPLSRFGRYTLDVVDAQGERLYFGMYESMADSNRAKLQMASAFPGARISQGTMSDQAFKLFAGVTPESLELFGNMLGLHSQGDQAQDKAFQQYLQLTKNNHSALKRLIHRKGIAGYSEDVGRVLASFVYSNARQAAGGLNAGTMDAAINAIPKEQGELKDVAMGLRSYIQDPQEEGQAVRGFLFAQYLGGSVASAFVNTTQPFAVTLPWLSQYGGMRNAGAQLARALKDMGTRGMQYEVDLARALQQAEDDGVVSPQEIHQLMAQARGAGTLRVGDGTRAGDARAAASNAWERTKVAWGQPFALAEQFNRRSTFIAAYRLAKEQGQADPAGFARRAVLETQFLYSKANKPRWARGAVGGTLFTFKTYSVSYLELMQRMWTQGGPEGKRAVGWAVAMLLLMGGAGGLPFMEDAEDLIDGAAQLMGYNLSSKQWRKQLLSDVLGKELAEFMEQGVSGLPGAPVDVSGRLGMGNLLPGTGLLMTKQSRERDLLEIAGPAGDLVARGFSGARKLLTGDVAGAALEISPTAVRNAAKGADMAASGIYKDAKGYKVIDTTLDEALAKAVGFQPKSVAEVQEANSFMQRSKSFYTQTSSEIKAQWAQALFEKDEAALRRVRGRLEAWNRDNPEQRIVVRMPDVWKRVREMGKDRTQRIADTAPKALRQQMREMAREVG